MSKINHLSLILVAAVALFITACDNELKNAPDLEDSLELFAGLELVPEASNSVLIINQGNDLANDGYFTVQVNNVLSNPIIQNIETEAWCLEWTKPLRSDNDIHEEVRWFSTVENDKWKPLNYLFSIRNDLDKSYENLTYREIQAVVWVIAGYMGIAPEFNVSQLSANEMPSRLRSNGEVNFNRDYVREISARVLNEYSEGAISISGFALQTANDEQDIFVPIRSSIVMRGLNSPIGMTIGPDGGLYVAEAGLPEINGPCVPVHRMSSNCHSGTGSISRLLDNLQERIITGLPSAYNADHNDVIGPHHLSFSNSNLFVTIGWGGPPEARNELNSFGEYLGTLLEITPGGGSWNKVADIAAFEQDNNPDGQNLDSNPYGLLSESDYHFIVDAGGNTLLEMNSDGTLSLIAVFPQKVVPPGPYPPIPIADAVPTQVKRGPDGSLYVSTLTGAPFLPGSAVVYKILPDGTPEVYTDGLTQVTDFDWDNSGNLYVLQYASAPFFGGPGSLLRITPGGDRKLILTNLANPTGLALGDDGSIYIVQKHNVAGGGEVVRYQYKSRI